MTISDEFVRESTSQLRALSDGLIAIEQSPGDAAALDEAFRTAHSLKGNCAMAGLDDASAVAHAVEDVLSAVRAGEVQPKADLIDAALDGTDAIDALVDAAQRGTTSDTDHDATVETLRERLAARREADATVDPVVAEEASSDDTDESAETADQPDDLDADVLDALDTAAEYDDLDELLSAMDDDGDIAEMPDLPEAKDLGEETAAASSETAGDTESPASAPSGEGPFAVPDDDAENETDTVPLADDGDDDDDLFAAVRAEVEDEAESDFEALQADLDEVSFGEFDDDDDLTIDELIDGPAEDDAGGFRFGEDRADADEDPLDAPFGTDADEPTPAPDPDAGFDGSGPFAEASAGDADADAGFDGAGPFETDTEDATVEATAQPADEEADLFAAVQAEVATEDAADLDELQADLDEVSFGEFDDDDDLTIGELIDADAVSDEESATASETPDATTERSVAPDAPTLPADLDPAITVAASPEPQVPSVGPVAPELPDGLTPAVRAASGPVDVPELPTASEEATETAPADYAAMGWGDLQSHAAARSVYRPGMTREAVEMALGALDAGAAEDVAIAAARPDDDPTGASSEPAAVAAPEPPVLPDDLTSVVEAASGPVEVPDLPTDTPTPPKLPDDLTPAVTTASGEVDVPAVPADDLSVAVEEDEPELDADVEDLLSDSGFDDLSASEDDADEPELDADVDELLDSSFEEHETDVEFARDTATEAFENRFGQLFGVDDGAVTRTVTSLADSSAADLFADPADERQRVDRDRVQSITVDVENAEALLSMVEELTTTRYRLEGALGDSRDEDTVDALSGLQSVTANLRRTVMDLRLMPFETATRDLQRLVRDTARAQDKRVSLAVSGREVGLDRSVIDRLGAPLVHVVRNAVDHGIESPEAREATGKDSEGTVEVRAERARDGVVIEVEDDGRGIDVDAVRQRVVDDGLLSAEEAADLPDEELYPYVFEAGLSTADEVTDVSGRGVGMDVVDRVTSDLGGSVDVESTPGEGTTVRLRLPITVAVAEVMFVQSGAERYGIPLTAIEEVEPVSVRDSVEGEQHVAPDGTEEYPLVRIEESLSTPGTHEESGVAVRLRPETRRAALHCDRVVETREVVIRPFEGALGEVPGVSGATLLGDGELVNIIDVATI